MDLNLKLCCLLLPGLVLHSAKKRDLIPGFRLITLLALGLIRPHYLKNIPRDLHLKLICYRKVVFMSPRVLPSVTPASDLLDIYPCSTMIDCRSRKGFRHAKRKKDNDIVYNLSILSTEKISSQNMHNSVHQ